MRNYKEIKYQSPEEGINLKRCSLNKGYWNKSEINELVMFLFQHTHKYLSGEIQTPLNIDVIFVHLEKEKHHTWI